MPTIELAATAYAATGVGGGVNVTVVGANPVSVNDGDGSYVDVVASPDPPPLGSYPTAKIDGTIPAFALPADAQMIRRYMHAVVKARNGGTQIDLVYGPPVGGSEGFQPFTPTLDVWQEWSGEALDTPPTSDAANLAEIAAGGNLVSVEMALGPGWGLRVTYIGLTVTYDLPEPPTVRQRQMPGAVRQRQMPRAERQRQYVR